MLDNITHVKPHPIEQQSFAIISEILGDRTFDNDMELVVKRVIHTTADFEFADLVIASPGAVRKAKKALEEGAYIYTDTSMVKSGINKRILAKLGGSVECYIGDEDIAKAAKEKGVTRSSVAIEKAVNDKRIRIYAIGNAPTALIRLCEYIKDGVVSPDLVIGAPVGFVNVVESKEMLKTMGVPYIITDGRKGGSNIAAAIVNAILYMDLK